MKQALTEIYNKKKQTIKILLENNNKLLAVVYKGLSNNKPLRDIHKEIKKTFINLPIKDEKMYKYALKVAKKGKKQVEMQVKSDILLTGAITMTEKKGLYGKYAFEFLNKSKTSTIDGETRTTKSPYTQAKSMAYSYAQEQESKSKEQVIKNALKSDKIYFLCSKHDDCAKDHSHFQGKLYYNREFRKTIPKEMWSVVDDYNKEHHLMTIQKVMGKPTWLITRPNCRHYFKQLSVEEVLGSNVGLLINKYDMREQIGIRDNIQTLYHNTKKEWYSEENIQSMIKKYEERLKFHQSMYGANDNDEIKKMIVKDKSMIARWKGYQRTRGKVINVN